MPLLDHIRACNAWSPDDFRPLWAGAVQIGWVETARIELFRAADGLFFDDPRGGLSIATPTGDPDRDGAAVDDALRGAVGAIDGVGGWRGEKLDVAADW
ncbi:MAG: hypothetical protein AAF684_09235, partial [Pseudomonadota bacterium]